ncbi:MAG: type II CAAX endopeptidase family protein [Candidatus Neomarinimicrobiota bacterium]
MFKRPVFWILLTLFSVTCIGLTVRYFPEAFPLVTLDLQMDRQAALRSARELALQHNWGPEEFRQAASFQLDRQTQTFVELEAGGTEAFARMLEEDLYSPYTWRIRHFREGETNETLIRFTPRGTPHGFVEKLHEEEPGASLTTDSALSIAVRTAEDTWGIDLNDYERVEESQETLPGGRTDHTFVWERRGVQVGEGKYRLRMVIGGDKLTMLTHFVKIPEAFSRRHQEMRSANNTIAAISVVVVGLLYILGGCIIGVFLLLRKRWILWRKPIMWGFVISFLQVLEGINRWPLTWMSYDTALTASRFLLTQIAILVISFISLGVIVSLAFMAAESLSRKAFPHHIQQWRLWSRGVANSLPVLGRTVAGYLLVSVFWTYEVGLYFFSTKVLGWWTPSEALFQPDVLATYFPWLSSIAISAQAGFLEESLFRAVPIAGAALLGTRFGHRKAWIAGAFVLQALVFSAAHANYPTQPAYARLVELIIPSIGFGLIYLFFGLLPAVILHFGVDVVAFAMPLFVSSAPGTWLNQLTIVLASLIPLLVVLGIRLRAGKWRRISETDYNRAWAVPEKERVVKEPLEWPKRETPGPATVRLVPLAGLVGLVLWFGFTDFRTDAPRLTISRGDATALAEEALSETGMELPENARTLNGIEGRVDQRDRFVWQTGGRELYEELMGEHLEPPHWRIRFVQFEGDVAERAEEFQAFVAGDGEVFRIRHQLPEAQEGASLSEEKARILAHTAIENLYGMDPAKLKKVSAEESRRPNRRDWLFTFADTVNYPLSEGEARIAIEISGDNIGDSRKYVHVPEDWARGERNRNNLTGILVLFCSIILIVALVTGIVGAVVRWSRKDFSVRVFAAFGTVLFGLGVISIINGWPATKARFSTAEPVSNQMFTAIAFPLLGILFLSIGVALLIGLIHNWKREEPDLDWGRAAVWGISSGAFALGVSSLIARVAPSLEPRWAEYASLGSYIPFLAAGMQPVVQYVTATTVLLIIFVTMDRFTRGWTKKKVTASAALVFMGVIITGSGSIDNLWFWIVSGLELGALLLLAYLFVLRFHLALVPLIVGTMMIMGEAGDSVYRAHPASLPGTILAITLTGLFSVFWYESLRKGRS